VTTSLNRRECLAISAEACAALSLCPQLLCAQGSPVITKPIPSTGERLPIVGLGSAAGFWGIAEEAPGTVRAIMRILIDRGGTVFDTAPAYLTSEEVAGRAVNELGARDRVFWATKLAPFRGGSVDLAEAWRQVESSFERLGRETIDLMQVHNLDADLPAQLSILRELKGQRRVRYIGAVTTAKHQYGVLEELMRSAMLDFIAVDYAVDNRSAEERVLPAALERGIAVIGYIPMRGLWGRVEGREVPRWAAEFGARSWAQFFLKFAASHPAITVVTPATSSPEHMLDNMEAGRGRLPDETERRRMAELIAALPA
jgi:aryl-alcohol dehydrogenase-like predicted oxidoreductase